MQLCSYAKKLSWKKFWASMGHDPQPGEIVLHAALLSELSTAGSWANENSVLYPILSE